METELGDQLIDIDDTAPIPGIEWEFIVDRAQAAMLEPTWLKSAQPSVNDQWYLHGRLSSG